jgi:HEAT repeat protein
MIVAELREEIQPAIPRIVECLKDSSHWNVRLAAIDALSSIAARGMCQPIRFQV